VLTISPVDALKVNRRDAEVRVGELAWDDVERDRFGCHLDGVRVAELMRGDAATTRAVVAWRFRVVRTAEGAHGRPAVAPSMTHRSAPTGSVTR
jgi:hypothetical protein